MLSMRIFSLILLIALALPSCSRKEEGTIEASGVVEARKVEVSAEISGRIDSLFVEEGDRVEKGQVICRLNTESLELKLGEARANLKAAKASLDLVRKGAREEEIKSAEERAKQARSSLENAQSNLRRIEKLHSEGVASDSQLENARTAYEVAKASYEMALKQYELIRKGARREEIELAEANYERALSLVKLVEKQISDATVTSPIGGIVTAKFVEAGEVVKAGAPIASISDLSHLWIRIYLSERDIGKVRPGDEVIVRVDSFPGRDFKGRVEYISPEAEFTPKIVQTKDTRVKLVFAVKVGVDNPDLALKVGLPADVLIKTVE